MFTSRLLKIQIAELEKEISWRNDIRFGQLYVALDENDFPHLVSYVDRAVEHDCKVKALRLMNGDLVKFTVRSLVPLQETARLHPELKGMQIQINPPIEMPWHIGINSPIQQRIGRVFRPGQEPTPVYEDTGAFDKEKIAEAVEKLEAECEWGTHPAHKIALPPHMTPRLVSEDESKELFNEMADRAETLQEDPKKEMPEASIGFDPSKEGEDQTVLTGSIKRIPDDRRRFPSIWQAVQDCMQNLTPEEKIKHLEKENEKLRERNSELLQLFRAELFRSGLKPKVVKRILKVFHLQS